MRIGIDLGGTKTECIVLDPNGVELLRRRVASPRHDYQATLANVARLVREVEQELSVTGSVGVGTPGAVSPASGRMHNCNSTWLNDTRLREDLEAVLERPVRIANDANCLVLSEASDGAAKGYAVVFGVILGTGVGGGIAVNGNLLAGANGIAGEWGHNPLPAPRVEEQPGPQCYCGLRGCIETWLSGPGMAADHLRVCGESLQAQEIATRAVHGEITARATVDRYCDRLARALAGIINVLDPHAIVLAGGVSNMPSLYQRVPELWSRYALTQRVQTALLPAKHGDSSGVRGAAWLWPV